MFLIWTRLRQERRPALNWRGDFFPSLRPGIKSGQESEEGTCMVITGMGTDQLSQAEIG